MIFPSNRVRVMVATKPIDFRKGHDSLAAMVKNELRKDPFTGTIFVFRARKADRLKLLYWDGTGLVMAYKRLEEHTFTWPAVKDGLMLMNHAQFEALFAGLGLFRFEGVSQRSVIIEQYEGVLSLLPSVPLGGPATVGTREGRSMRCGPSHCRGSRMTTWSCLPISRGSLRWAAPSTRPIRWSR